MGMALTIKRYLDENHVSYALERHQPTTTALATSRKSLTGSQTDFFRQEESQEGPIEDPVEMDEKDEMCENRAGKELPQDAVGAGVTGAGLSISGHT